MDLETFNSLVSRMLGNENQDRSAAEKQYDEIDRTAKVSLLFQLYLTTGAAPEVRSLCLVLLRRLISNEWDEIIQALGNENLKQLTDQILQSVTQEQNKLLRTKLADVLSETARKTIDEESGKQKWQDVLKFLEHCVQVDDEGLKQTAMTLIEFVPEIFGSDQDKYMGGIRKLFDSCLMHSSAEVRSSAAKALVAFVSMNDEDEKLVKSFSSSIPAIIEICKHVVQTEEQDDSPLQALSDLASTVPKMLTAHLPAIFDMCVQVIANTEKDESYRHSAMEVLTSICECAPNTVKKRHPNYITLILQSAILLMTELDDDVEEWLTVDDIEENDIEEMSPSTGECALDRIACALNGKVLLQPMQQIAQNLLADADWKKKHAALIALCTIGEGCKRAMEPVIDNVVNLIIPYLKDDHPRVRHAACHALGQMSSDFSPTLQKKCHEKVVAGLLSTLEDLSCPRVAAHAAAALVNFSEDCPQQVIAAYLQPMMAKFEFVVETTFKTLQEKGKKIILEQVITTIAAVADAAQKIFIQFYDRLMPPLKYILAHTEDPNLKSFRGKTIECMTLIGLAVGKEKFAADAVEIIQIVSGTLKTLTSDDPQCSYMMSSMGRISQILGPDFAPFLPLAMDSVLQAASYQPDVTVFDGDEANEEEPGWEYHSLGDKSLGIRTSGLEEKAVACEMIMFFARDLKEAFVPYVPQISDMMVTHVKFAFHDSVRSSAADTMPYLLKCVQSMGVDAMRHLWTKFFPALVSAIQVEEETEVMSDMLSSVSGCLEALGSEGITAEEVTKIGELIASELKSYEERRNRHQAQEAEEDEDPEEAKEMLDDEMQDEASILANLSDLIQSCFKILGEQFYVIVEPFLPQIMILATTQRHYSDRQWGACMLVDFLEYAPKRMAPFQDKFVPILLNCLHDQYPEVRQAAAYAFGVLAMKGGPEYSATCTAALEPLAAMISKPDARSTEEGSTATENAIAAVAKILKYGNPHVDVAQVIPAFISWLPTYDDQLESEHIYGYFCDLVESSHPAVLGADNSNLPKILDIAVSAFHYDAFEDNNPAVEAVKGRLMNIIKQLHSGGMLEKLVQSGALDQEKQITLQQLMTGQ